jgi:arsenite methyltransferase
VNKDFLSFQADFSSPKLLSSYDEQPLWSAMFGLLLLEEIPLSNVTTVLDVGCGTGFPLIELAERLGPNSRLHGIDPWTGALARAREKIAAWRVSNVTLHEGSAATMPFADNTFDLIVSNLGLNNFEDAAAAIRECRRVARNDTTLALTTNLQGHMQEFYTVFANVVHDDNEAMQRLKDHIERRATTKSVHNLLEAGRFSIRRVVERQATMRFRNGSALLNHHFIKLGFLDGWRQVAGEKQERVFTMLLRRLDELAEREGELRCTIPMAYVEAVAA